MTLHTEALPAPLLTLLRKLMQDQALADFYLVGGTSLALRLGHRESIDIDLFTHNGFDARSLAEGLKKQYGMVETQTAENTVCGLIDGIKTDLIAHRYPIIRPIQEIDGIRLASLEDVAAMKLNAIANRGGKKDFWDCAGLLQFFSRDELLGFCSRKYAGDSLWNIGKSLCYFDDAENDPDPRDLRGQTWEQIKAVLIAKARL